MGDLKFPVPAILNKLILSTVDSVTHTGSVEEFNRYMGWSADSNRVYSFAGQRDILFDKAVKGLSFFGYNPGIVIKDRFYAFTSFPKVKTIAANLLEADDRDMTWLAKRLGISYNSVRAWFKGSNSKMESIRRVFEELGYELIVRNETGDTFVVGSDKYYSYKLRKYLGDVEIPLSEATGYKKEYEAGLNGFADTCLEELDEGKVAVKELYARYLQFCKKSSCPALEKERFLIWAKNSYLGGFGYVYGIALKVVS